MTTPELILLGVALAMDAFAITISNMFVYRNVTAKHLALMAVFFGVFQGVMPVIGYVAGSVISEFVNAYAGIITCAILVVIGAKMIWDAIHDDQNEPQQGEKSLSPTILLLQAVATSIDALAVGVGFAMMSVNIFIAAVIIAVTTSLCCVAAIIIGKRFGSKLGDKAAIIGGLVLIAIGIKALL